MSKKSHVKNIKEVDDAIRVLSSSSIPDSAFLHKLSYLLKKYPQALSYHAGRLESSLLGLINVRKISCDLQKSAHTHYPHNDPSQKRAVPLAAMCFSLLPSLTNPPHRMDRFLEFQLKVLYGLSETYGALLSLSKFSHINLSSLHSYLSSKCKHFASLDSVKRDEMPSPEYLQLLYARIDFFTTTLRYLFESKTEVDCVMHLPLIVAVLTAILSVEVTSHGQTSSALLLHSSRLLHCLACICQSVGSKMMPASVSLLTLVVYQLDWTASWRDGSKLAESLVRHRLAAYRCLRVLISEMTELSSSRLISLLPRLLDQMTQDIVCCGATDISSKNSALGSHASDDSVESASSNSFERRVLLAVLDVVSRTFRSPGQFNNLSESLSSGMHRLQLCLLSAMRTLTSDLLGTPVSKRANSFHNALTHPSVLKALLEASRVLCTVSHSPRFRSTFVTFAHELKAYPSSQVRSTACDQLMLLAEFSPIKPIAPSPEEPRQVIEPPIVKEVATPVFKPDSIKVQNECPSATETPEPSTKRRRTDFPEDLATNNPGGPESTPSNIDACLSSFDPTFV